MSSVTSATSSSTASTTATSTSTSSSGTTSTNYASTDVSSIDWDGLIEELYQAKLAKTDTYETKITKNQNKITAYQDAADLLSTLKDAATALRVATDSSGKDDDVFDERTAYLTAVGGVDTASTLSVSAEAGADTGSYSITVQQLATAHKVAGSRYSSSSTDLSLSGSFTLGIEGGTSVSISLTEDMSLAEIASAINKQSGTSGVKATVLKVSGTSYELVLSSAETGETISVGDDDGVLKSLGIVDEDGAFADELQTAQNAIFTVDGVSITRSTNDIDDVIDGVSFYLYSTTTDGQSITVEIGQNLSDIKTAVTTFVDAYNAYREWALSQQQLSSSGGASSDSVLFGDATIRSINQQIASALTFSLDEASLSAIGLSFDENNDLELDEDTLDDVLLDDPDLVQRLFAYTFESSSSDVGVLYRGTGAPSTFQLEISVDGSGALSSVTVNGQSGLFTVAGNRIKGVAGTAYEGYTLVFTGSTSQSVTIKQASGIAEQIYNLTKSAINSDDGKLTALVTSLTEKNDDYQTQIDDITSRADTYKTNLTTRYARLQASISTAQSTLAYLEALLAAKNSD
ncbi:flagellar filament capping protein FliD [Pleomorphomonas koreensis]|uniref:flagellar filament capping protein FliD n=1 Tax=Pleomorphomonas koreensis TaxID=257440 RepID=UPI00040F4FE9|nr:flagellar filament capping protein FliD [Pleomorphomonas koreensis]